MGLTTTPRTLRYEVWDVFTAARLTGNQLAVFPDATGLDTESMLALAREMNFSESTFVIPGAAGGPPRVRIFLKTHEIDFAGHPVLGTAFSLRGRSKRRTVEMTLNGGPMAVGFEGNEGEMLQPEPEFLETYSARTLAWWVGLPVSAIVKTPPVQAVSTGRPNILAMLSSVEDLGRVKFDWTGIDGDAIARERGFYLLAADGPGRFRARKIMRDGEDPVTGSAGGAAIAWLVEHGLARPGERVRIEQGVEMLRPGWMTVSAGMDGQRVTHVRVGGTAVRTMKGVLTL